MENEKREQGNSIHPYWKWIGKKISDRAVPIVVITIFLTILLLIPMVIMAPEKQASGEPGGEVFDLTDNINEILPPANMYWSFILEARDGDALTQKVLSELLQNEEILRNSQFGRENLSKRFDVEIGEWNQGVYTIADAVDQFLRFQMRKDLTNASDDEVKLAIHYILLSPEGEGFKDSFSVKANSERKVVLGEEIDLWTSPALFVNTVSNKPMVLSNYSSTLDGNLEEEVIIEHYNRDLQSYLRGDQQSYRLWGIAIDISLEAQEEGMLSFPLIFAAVILILVIVTLLFRSFKILTLTFFGLIMLIIWLKGLSNLVGLNSSLTIDILVPVSILVLGVDYAIHAFHRYEEERNDEPSPRKALGLSVAGVGGALILAMVTTVVAFGSNAISNIEEIIGFGVSASLAIISAFWIMGFFLPAAKMVLDERSKRSKAAKKRGVNGRGPKLLVKVVMALVKRRAIILPLVLILSIGSGYLAIQLEAQLDVKEYFDPSSDVVVSLDKLDEHAGEKGGEPAYFFIEGDLSDPEVLSAMLDFKEELADDDNIAREQDTGEVLIYADIFQYFRRILSNNYTVDAIEGSVEGLNITDNDGNWIPDGPDQLEAILDYIYFNGIPMNNETMMYDTDQVHEILWINPESSSNYATIIVTGVPDTRELSTVQRSAKEFKEDMEVLDVEGVSYYGLTGSGYERDATLTAVTDSLTYSIAVAVVLCFIVLVILLRSFKYAIVTVIPEVLVAAWLYAFMFIAGFHLNAVTATIAAISIGVGIDYSVHITARFKQELIRTGDREEALKYTVHHSGVALFGSAASTMVGFAIISFAPMPMFSSFGILTALMILMAFVAALFVLPSLLMMVTPKGHNPQARG